MSKKFHISVLPDATIDYLQIEKGRMYIDATLGGGGHTLMILRLGGRVLGIDQDKDAIDFVDKNLEGIEEYRDNLTLVRDNFRNIRKIAEAKGFSKVEGVLFDLGVSSYQLDTPERGFSFKNDGPLDMRMDQDLELSAFELLHGLRKDELEKLFRVYGEEKFARLYAEKIVRYRESTKIVTTSQLADLIASGSRAKGKIHPATRVFQALRIAVNDELVALKEALSSSIELLSNNARLVVISFHSLEDRIVKNSFRDFEEKGLGQIVTKKPIVPDNDEIEVNARSRSSKLRVFERKL